MMNSDILKAALLRLAAGNANEAEREMVQRALQDDQIALATGDRAVALGGNATDTVIITGDGNIVLHFQGVDAQALRSILQQISAGSESATATFIHPLINSQLETIMPFTAPSLPKKLYVERPAELEALLKFFLDDKGESHVAPIAALKGNGGFGKTILAQAFCFREEALYAFSDGILWVTLGEHPNVLYLLLDQIEYLSGLRPGFTDTYIASKRLDEIISDRKMLLVLDDVWSVADALPFVQVGKQCAKLLTTRRQEIVVELQAQVVSVNEMEVDEAAQLLINWLDTSPVDTLPFKALAQRLGEWPLLLSLSGAYLRESVVVDEQTLDDALAGLNERLDRLGFTAFDRSDERQRNQAISLSLAVSLERLGLWQDRYFELAIFPPDVPVPFKTVEQLWGVTASLSNKDTEDALQIMRRLSLFTDYNAVKKTVRLHDVIRVYLGSQLSDEPMLHAKLVDQWGDPYRLPDQYAWRWYIYHLRMARRYEDILRLADKPFLAAKMEHFHSYVPLYEDLREALSAAEVVGDHVKMLGLALVYSGLQSRVIQMSNADIIQLYARFGEVDRALELAASIQDYNIQASSLVKIAQELLPLDLPRAKQIARDILVHWNRYEPGYTCGLILRQIFDILPEEFISFLESIEDFSPVNSLGNSSLGEEYDAVDTIGSRLEPRLKKRLIDALIKSLSLVKREQDKQELRLLLARFIDNLDEAAQFADNEVAHVIIAAKYDRIKNSGEQPSDEVVGRMVDVFIYHSTQDEKDVVFRYAIEPIYEAFSSALERIDVPNVRLKVEALLDLAMRSAGIARRTEQAKTLLLKAIEADSLLPERERTILKTSHPGTFDVAIKEIIGGLAANSLQTALEFLSSPMINSNLYNLTHEAILAAARTNPHDTLKIANEQNLSQNLWAKALLAEGIACNDLAEAMFIWRGIDKEDSIKQKTLISILKNAPPKDYQYARTVLQAELRLEPPFQIYKVPALLDVVIRLQRADPDRAKSLLESALKTLYGRLEGEKSAKVLKEFFLVKLVRPLVLCGFVRNALDIQRSLSKDNGLSAIAAADILEALSQDALSINEEDVGEYTIPSLLENARNRWAHGHNSSGASNEIVKFVEYLLDVNSSRLTSLYLSYQSRASVIMSWLSDYVKAQIAPKIAPYRPTAAIQLTEEIKDVQLQKLTLVDLANVLPLKAISKLEGLGEGGLLLAIAYLRLAKDMLDGNKRHAFLELAFKYAQDAIKSSLNEFDLFLIIQFTREAGTLDAQMALSLAPLIIKAVLASIHHRTFHLLYGLRDIGYVFSKQEKNMINHASVEWVTKANEMVAGKWGANELLCRELIFVAQSTLPVDFDAGKQFLDMARRHAQEEQNSIERQILRSRILKCLLFSGKLEAWIKAVAYSIEDSSLIFETFEWFVLALLKLQSNDSKTLFRLIDILDWAENLMKL